MDLMDLIDLFFLAQPENGSRTIVRRLKRLVQGVKSKRVQRLINPMGLRREPRQL